MKQLLLLPLILLLAACAQPKTLLPSITPEEIAEEREYQEKFLYEQDFTHLYEATPTKRAMEKRLARVAKRIGPAAIKLCNKLRMTDKANKRGKCVFDAELGPKDDSSINAYADGSKIVIGRKLMELIQSDQQLAFIVAHEFSHNIMGHIDDKKTNMTGGAVLGAILDVAVAAAGVNTQGAFTKAGMQAGVLSFSPSYEHEADYVGLYIMKRAGYKIGNASNVWRMMAAANPDSIYTKTTHPSTPERFVMMKKTVTEIEAKRKAKEPLLPEMKADQVAATDDSEEAEDE